MMTPQEWSGELYTGASLPPGLRVSIGDSAASSATRHWCGNTNPASGPEVPCPNCRRALFNVFDLDMGDTPLATLDLWNRERLLVRVCPSCPLYFQPYWVVEDASPVVVGGERDGGRILQDVRPPYPPRPIDLSVLEEDDYPTTSARVQAMRARRHGNGVYHQLGGVPFRGGYAEMKCCRCDDRMRFSGVVDYDDLNVPLYENDDRRPVALIIGDSACLNLFTCAACSVTGLSLAR